MSIPLPFAFTVAVRRELAAWMAARTSLIVAAPVRFTLTIVPFVSVILRSFAARFAPAP